MRIKCSLRVNIKEFLTYLSVLIPLFTLVYVRIVSGKQSPLIVKPFFNTLCKKNLTTIVKVYLPIVKYFICFNLITFYLNILPTALFKHTKDCQSDLVPIINLLCTVSIKLNSSHPLWFKFLN